MASTLTDLVQRTVSRLSMVPGVAVQVYAEDRIAEMILHKFIMVRSELWWDDLMQYAQLTQSVDGTPNENVVRELPPVIIGDEIVIHSYNDIQHAWRQGDGIPLKMLPGRTNPLAINRPGRTVYRTPSQSKVIRFVPYSPGAVMAVRYKRWYSKFLPADTVPMDDQVLILGAAYDYLEDDGTNAGQTEKFRNLFNDRLRQLKGAENEREIPLSSVPVYNSNYQVIN